MILAIESSCDESALACFDPSKGLSNELISSQIKLHAEYGGVVPDLASREHLANFPKLLEELKSQQDLEEISQIVVTRGPGLAACLALGITFAKAIALVYDLPVRGVHHLHGHAYSPFIPLHEAEPTSFKDTLVEQLPHCGLIVSGGNTIIIEIDENLNIRTLARTVDDAAGEAIDKGAKLLGLPYPGGPMIEKLATEGKPGMHEFPVSFPKPRDWKFSFSGLKTSLRYTLEKIDDAYLDQEIHNICHSYQEAVIEQLIRKMGHILDAKSFNSIGLSGGVSNNGRLRERFLELGNQSGLPTHIAKRRHTGDNAGMIAFSAWLNPKATTLDTKAEPLGIQPSEPIDTH